MVATAFGSRRGLLQAGSFVCVVASLSCFRVSSALLPAVSIGARFHSVNSLNLLFRSINSHCAINSRCFNLSNKTNSLTSFSLCVCRVVVGKTAASHSRKVFSQAQVVPTRQSRPKNREQARANQDHETTCRPLLLLTLPPQAGMSR